MATTDLITEDDLTELRTKLEKYKEAVRGSDEILVGLTGHLIRQIEADMTLLWFYGKALRARAGKGE